jgi:pyridoxamine 5'-phosphate oxidase
MKKTSIAKLDRQYPNHELLESSVPKDPFRLFHVWFARAAQARLLDPHAMALSTVDPKGNLSSRMVLLKALDKKGFVFFTNYLSRKGRELTRHPQASLLFYWPQLGRQVRVEGKTRRIPAKESNDYFKTRPRGSQLSAWASHQSRVIPNRATLEKRMKELESLYEGRTIPRPPHWGGYRLIPRVVEFWSGRRNRLHDRLRYRKKGQDGWKMERLAP